MIVLKIDSLKRESIDAHTMKCKQLYSTKHPLPSLMSAFLATHTSPWLLRDSLRCMEYMEYLPLQDYSQTTLLSGERWRVAGPVGCF